MFPNFKSLADKERKRRALLRQISTDSEIDQIKKDAYALADWASDIEGRLSLAKAVGTTSTGTQTDGVSLPTVSNTPSPPSTASPASPASPNVNQPNETEDIGDENESLSDIDDSEPARVRQSGTTIQEQRLALIAIKEMFHRFPELTAKRISPIRTSGLPEDFIYIGKDGDLFYKRTDKKSRKRLDIYDWKSTLAYIKELFESKLRESASPSVPVNVGLTLKGESTVKIDAFNLLQSILNKNDLPIKPIPYKKGHNPKKRPIPVDGSFEVNKSMQLIDRDGRIQKPRYDVSWANTLEMFIKELNRQKIRFKTSERVITSRPYTPWGVINDRETNIDTRETGIQEVGSNIDEEAMFGVIELFNDNPELAHANINPVFKTTKDGKSVYSSKNYTLAEYAKILKANGADLSKTQSKKLENSVDWHKTRKMIVETYLGLNNVNRRSALRLSELGETDAQAMSGLSGIGVAGLRGRRSVLKHEFDKLQGEAGLGNDSRRVSRELRLLRKIF